MTACAVGRISAPPFCGYPACGEPAAFRVQTRCGARSWRNDLCPGHAEESRDWALARGLDAQIATPIPGGSAP